jgi:ribose 5-phosphate isomerase RpiB
LRIASRVNEELTNRIVKDVLSALGKAPAGAAVKPSGGAPGTTAASSATASRARVAGASSDDAAPRTTRVFITAQTLRQRLNATAGAKVVELAWNEVLTPNALDYVQQVRLDVRRSARPAPEPASTATEPAESHPRPPLAASQGAVPRPESEDTQNRADTLSDSPIGLVVSRPDGKVAAVLASIEREGIALVPFAQTDCPVRNLTALCEAIGAGRFSRGVVIAAHAAGAMVLAGKCRGVRPVQATRASSVEAGLRQFAANLLVVEHAFSTFHEIRAMVRLFAAAPGAPPTDRALMDALGRLGGA